MLSLEVQISKRTNRWVDVTNDFLKVISRNYLSGRKYWRAVNYRDGEHRGLSLPGGDGGVD